MGEGVGKAKDLQREGQSIQAKSFQGTLAKLWSVLCIPRPVYLHRRSRSKNIPAALHG